jgi:hypothetical protein
LRQTVVERQPHDPVSDRSRNGALALHGSDGSAIPPLRDIGHRGIGRHATRRSSAAGSRPWRPESGTAVPSASTHARGRASCDPDGRPRSLHSRQLRQVAGMPVARIAEDGHPFFSLFLSVRVDAWTVPGLPSGSLPRLPLRSALCGHVREGQDVHPTVSNEPSPWFDRPTPKTPTEEPG